MDDNKKQFQVSPQAPSPDQPIKSNSWRVLLVVICVVVVLITLLVSLIDIIINEKPVMRNAKLGPVTFAVDRAWITNPKYESDTYTQYYHVYDDTLMFILSVSCNETTATNNEAFLTDVAERIVDSYEKYPAELISSEFITVNGITGYRFKYIVEWNSYPKYEYNDEFHTIIDEKIIMFSFSLPQQDLDDYELIIEEVLNSIKTVSGKTNPLVE